MTRALALIPLLIAVVFGGFFLWGLNPDRDPNDIPSVLISQQAPEFTLMDVEGLATPSFARTDLVGNQGPVIVNVFASWCVPCRAEHAVLTQLVEREGQRLFGINYKDKPEDAVRWLTELGNPYEMIGADSTGRAGIEWGISGVPETFIVGSDGTVLYRYVGPVVGDDAVKKFREALDQAGAMEIEAGG
ncbi:cytochrome c biogenesis protein CcmG/thiol:disulfide interchange protein DsbE [Loktanella sp. PT4BL]|jgi:cytochrome c biogenesis protein CcmG/thiol:disulfide interchange protein DsbE|uniref:DsbE family thiol:disulfide interchange protein n=1 Tax=Loktanella sp. PT4BL TaxID=2135611 RepID=UPI000D774648|nr:DsbE family thiol:disulfide interchange protein [Loktanella sp. PT4BL]PXW67213.1 cytochrome c biogenesis protein CcmG/thiol:disulfide interchange protein DsbE [Loktanella sp. PT4BL]